MIGEMFLAVAAGVRPTGALGEQLRQEPRTEPGAMYGPLIIEMFGVPGGGKSTLVNAVYRDEDRRTRQELTAAWNGLALRQRSAFLLRALVDLRCLISATRFAICSRLWSSESLARLVRVMVKAHWVRSRPGEMLLDQSLLQEIWSICVSAGRNNPDHVSLARFIRFLYSGLPTQIVFVETDAAIASRRISGRSHGFSRLDGMAAAIVEDRLARAAQLPHAIIAAAIAAGLAVERLDGADPVELNAERLRSLLMARSCGEDSD